MTDVKQLIRDTAAKYGEDAETALRIASIETGGTFNPRAQNPGSTAGGIFQFIDSTWKGYAPGKSKYDAFANVDAGIRLLRDNRKTLTRALGRAPTPGELYLAHQQGSGGALKLLSNPNRNAAELLGTNEVRKNGGNSQMTAMQFAGLWTKKMGDTSVSAAPAVFVPGSMETPGSQYHIDAPSALNTTDTGPTQNLTVMEQREIQEKIDANTPSLLEGAQIAFKNGWSISAMDASLAVATAGSSLGLKNAYEQWSDGRKVDPNFRVTEDLLRTKGEGIPTEYLDDLADAVSEEHMDTIRDKILQRMDENQKLANMGMTGTLLQLAAGITDPGAIAATAAIGAVTGGLGLPAAVGARFGRLGMIALGAAEGVAGNVITEIPLIANDPTRHLSFDELKYSIGTGIVMGGLMGGLRSKPSFAEEADEQIALGAKLQQEAQAIASAADNSVGAARAGAPDQTVLKSTMEDMAKYAPLNDYIGSALKIRIDSVAKLARLKTKAIRVFAPMLGEDAVRAAKGVTPFSMTEAQAQLHRSAHAAFVVDINDPWKKWAKRNNVKMLNEGEAKQKFSNQVAAYVRERSQTLKDQFDPEVQAAGEALNKMMKRYDTEMRTSGLVDDGFKPEANYFPRYDNLERSSNMMSQFGWGRRGDTDPNAGLTGFVKMAIKRAQPDIDDDLARDFAEAFLQRKATRAAGMDSMGGGFQHIDLDNIADELGDLVDKDTMDNMIAYLTSQQKRQAGDGTQSSRLKSRITMDENFEAKLPNRLTGEMETARMADFWNNDVFAVANQYSRHMSGWVAAARTKVFDPDTGEIIQDGIRSQRDWDRLKEKFGSMAKVNGDNWSEVEKDLDFLFSAVVGKPIERYNQNSSTAQWLRMFRQFNFIRLMGQMGWNQIAEIPRAISQVGLKTTLHSVPAFKQIVKQMRSGKPNDELGWEMYHAFAPASDWNRTAHFIAQDEFGVPHALGGNSFTSRVEAKVAPALHSAARVVTMGSGMKHITEFSQLFSARMSALHFAEMASFGKKINYRRMEGYGLSRGDLKDIFEEINKHAQYKGGNKPANLSALGLDKWNPVTRSKIESAMFRMNRNMVMENDPGQMHRLMTHPFGQVLMQFRSFVAGAYTKGTLQAINMRDKEAAFGILGSTLFGSMAYMGQRYVSLIGDKDREEKMAKDFTLKNLALAGFARTSESSIIPMMVDNAALSLGMEAQFNNRTSQLRQDALGNPTFDLINTGIQAVQGVTSAVAGDDFSKQDFNAIRRVTFFQNLIGVQQFFNWLASGLPNEIKD